MEIGALSMVRSKNHPPSCLVHGAFFCFLNAYGHTRARVRVEFFEANAPPRTDLTSEGSGSSRRVRVLYFGDHIKSDTMIVSLPLLPSIIRMLDLPSH
jgi:hypothetical protein